MTRADVTNALENIETEYGFNTHDVQLIIARIFNDFEDRTCSNCRKKFECKIAESVKNNTGFKYNEMVFSCFEIREG